MCDQLILSVFYIGYFILVIFNAGHYFVTKDHTAIGWITITTLVVISLADFAYYWAFHSFMNGQTPGKRLMGIRVVTQRGGKINATTALIRGVFNIVDMALFSGGVSALMILMTQQEKRIADFAAGTIVVQDS